MSKKQKNIDNNIPKWDETSPVDTKEPKWDETELFKKKDSKLEISSKLDFETKGTDSQSGFKTVTPFITEQKDRSVSEKPEEFVFDEQQEIERQKREKESRERKYTELKETVEPIIDESLIRIDDEIDKIKTDGTYYTGMALTPEGIPEVHGADLFYLRQNQLKNFRQAKRTLIESKKFIEKPTQEGLKSFFNGLSNKNTIDYLTIGMSEVFEGFNDINIAGKQLQGRNFTQAEQELLAAKYIIQELKSAKETGMSYDVGLAIAEMLPFIAQLVLTRGAGTVGEKTAEAGLKQVLKKEIVNKINKYGLTKIVGAATQAPFMGTMWEQVAEKKTGILQQDEEGKIEYTGGESTFKAIRDAYLNTFSELATERAGEIFKANVSKAGTSIGKNINKLDNSLSNLKKLARWDGLMYEWGEEQLNTVAQSILTGDASISDLFDLRKQFELFATLAIMQGGFKTLEIPGYAKTKMFEAKIKNKADQLNKEVSTSTTEEINNAFKKNSIDEIREELNNYGYEGLSGKQQSLISDYIALKFEQKARQGINLGVEQTEETEVEQEKEKLNEIKKEEKPEQSEKLEEFKETTPESVKEDLLEKGYSEERANEMVDMFNLLTSKYKLEPKEFIEQEIKPKKQKQDVIKKQDSQQMREESQEPEEKQTISETELSEGKEKLEEITYDSFKNKMLSDLGQLNNIYTQLNNKEREAARKNLLKGKETKQSKILENDLKAFYEQGHVDLVIGSGKNVERKSLPIDEIMKENIVEPEVQQTVKEESIEDIKIKINTYINQQKQLEIEDDKKQLALDKISTGFDDFMKSIGGVQMALGEEKPQIWNAIKQIADGVYELGALNLQEFIDNIKKLSDQVFAGNQKFNEEFKKVIDDNKKDIEKLYEERSKKRKFGEKLMKDSKLRKEVKEGLSKNALEYIPTSNEYTQHEVDVIIEEKGLNESMKMVVNENNSINPRVRVALGVTLIDKYNNIIKSKDYPQNRKDIAINDSIQLAEFMTEYGTKLGQGIQAYYIWSKMHRKTLQKNISKEVKKQLDRDLTAQEQKDIDVLIKKIETAPEGFQKFRATQDLLRYVEKIKGIKLYDLGLSIWYAHILSGYSTQVLNTMANMAETAGEIATSVINNPKSSTKLLSSLIDGYGRGILEAWSILKTGYNPLKSNKWEYQKNRPSTLEVYNGFKLFNRQWNPFKFHKYVGRAMTAVDAFFYHGLKEMRAYELAHREALGSGLKSKQEIDNYVNNKLNRSKERIDEAKLQAEKEGLKGIEKKMRMWELLEQSRPKEITEDANDFASRGTFNYSPEGRIGYITDMIGKLVDNVEIRGTKPLKFIVPFTSILTNVANRYLDWTPYGFYRTYTGRIGAKAQKGSQYYRELSQEERAKTFIRASIGTITGGALYILSAELGDGEDPIIEITANGTGDYKKNYNLKAKGWKEYSVKIGDKWISYKNTPLAIPLAVIGNIRDAEKYKQQKLDNENIIKKTEIVLWNTVQYFTDFTFMQGVKEFITALSSSEQQAENYLTKFSGRIGKSIILPNLFTQVSRGIQDLYDMPMKQVNNIWEDIYRDMPIARNNLNDLVNSLGEPVSPKTNRWVSKEEYDPVWNLIIDNEAWVTKPAKNITTWDPVTGEERTLNNEEYYRYAKLRGQIIKQSIEKNFNKLEKMNKEEVKDELKKYKTNATHEAKRELMIGQYSKKTPKSRGSRKKVKRR